MAQQFKGSKVSKVHITTDPARGMVYNTDKKTDNDTMLFVIILVIKKYIYYDRKYVTGKWFRL